MKFQKLFFEAFLVSLSTVLFDIFLDYLKDKKNIKISYKFITIIRFITHLIFGYIGLNRLCMSVLI